MTEAASFPAKPASAGARDILPIFSVRDRGDEDPETLAFMGTGFRLTRELLVTCWHCVPDPPESEAYVVAILDEPPRYRIHELLDIARDERGLDLATARIFEPDSDPVLAMRLSPYALPGGGDVWTWGYPLSGPRGGHPGQWAIESRYLQGYVTRRIFYEHPTHPTPVPSYELDMPAPAGLSGAPLFEVGTANVVGVVYGTHDVARVEQFASIDPDTGAKTATIERVVSFALAHDTSSLHGLRGPATKGLTLADFLSGNEPATGSAETGRDRDELEASETA